MLVYAYASGVFSSRRITRRLDEDAALRVSAADNFPAGCTIREFLGESVQACRDRHCPMSRWIPYFSNVSFHIVHIKWISGGPSVSRNKGSERK